MIRKILYTTGDLIGNKIANKITRASKTSQRNKWELDKIIDDLSLKEENY